MHTCFAMIVLVLVFIAPPSFGNADKLTGIWEAGDRAHEATIGFLKISPHYLYFSGNGQNWQCKTGYEIVSNGSGNTYSDQLKTFQNTVKTRTWEYMKIRLGTSECTQSLFLLFAFASDIDNYADLVEYNKESKSDGWGHFHKLYDLESNDLTIDQAAPARKMAAWSSSCQKDVGNHKYSGSERYSFFEKCLGKDLRASQEQWHKCLNAKRESVGLAYTEYLRKCLNQ